ncbi:hypothetical protein QV08_01340 [Gallibacterium salpingitidis]|uniref:Uncharacterized protein n=1 Tax=Gallibacterium salpingitidis TaxID=505341 RepID=A0AB36E3W4_9PAST|nr:hypothetical protein [Gallibacterium salpingitidis]OBX09606.1 hypothetical protein QV08_01340 [Gallibacterium salpingitidis]OBX10461.1 hypothetical protein QV09_05895 [Gallibacterium salpingitidis]
MGILDSMTQAQQQTTEQPQQAMEQPAQQEQQGSMAQMYQMVMENSINAIANTAEERIKQKGPIDGSADLIATAMVSNLQAARQNGKTIPPQVLMQVAKDLAMQLLAKLGVPEDQLDDVLMDVLLRAMEQFGDMSQGLITPEEEQQYVAMLQQVSQAAKEQMGAGNQASVQQQPQQMQ